MLTEGIRKRGIILEPTKVNENLPDPKDVVFYAVTMEARKEHNAYLVTGNTKHFPLRPYVVTPREMLSILKNSGRLSKQNPALPKLPWTGKPWLR